MVIIASIDPAVVITSAGALGHDLVGRNLKARQRIWPEGGDDRHIRGVPTASHEHPSDAWRIKAGIENVPLAAEVGLKPARKVHRRIHCRYTDIPKIASAVARRDIHAPAKRDCQMGEVSADTIALLIRLPGSLGRTRMLVAEF